jgi:hypothetical protein
MKDDGRRMKDRGFIGVISTFFPHPSSFILSGAA